MQRAWQRIATVPTGPTPDEAATVRAVSELQFPLEPRKPGALFDGFVSNPAADRFIDAVVHQGGRQG